MNTLNKTLKALKALETKKEISSSSVFTYNDVIYDRYENTDEFYLMVVNL